MTDYVAVRGDRNLFGNHLRRGRPMIEIPISKHETVSSEEVAAVVFPCTSFESHQLWKDLQERWGFSNDELLQPRMTRPVLVDWVEFLGEKKPINVTIWCWRVRGVWLCFVEPTGDIFSYNIVEDWLHGHFRCTYDKGSRGAFFDPMNFHNCVAALKQAIQAKSS